MAIEGDSAKVRWLIPGLGCTIPYLLGMVLIYVGERLVSTPPEIRFVLDGVGGLCILWAVIVRTVNWLRTRDDRRAVEGMMLAGYWVGLVSLGLYAAQLVPVREAMLPWLEGAKVVDRYQVILQVLWPILWISAVLPVVLMEISYASMTRAPQIERHRVAFSAKSGLAVAWLLAGLFVINYVASSHNRKWDLSYQRTGSASEDARRLVSNLSEPFEVVLVFPDVNEVREEVAGYFDPLRASSDLFQIGGFDQVLEPKQAEELGVRQNGSLVYRYGDKKEVQRIGLTLDDARSNLAKLDQEFQGKFLKLVAEKKLAYFTTGHGERPYDWQGDKDPRSPVKGLKTILKKQNFDVKPLGVGQGLASEVPDDASLLLVVDPTEDFLPEELESLQRYLDKGGRIWIVLDPDHASNLAGLLEGYGLRFSATKLANDRYFMRAKYSKADRYNLFSNRTSSHASVTTLSRNSSRLAVVLPGSGFLEKNPEKKGKGRLVMTLRSMPMTWQDKNRNLELDEPEEEKKTYDLGAAVSLDVAKAGAREESDSSVPPASGKGGKNEMRMLVLADADALSDRVIGNLGNYYLFLDGLKWLFEEEKFIGSVKTEEDVRITHTKEEDVVWFYTTIFGVPTIVLSLGVFYNRFRIRKKGRGKTG
jgi:hypothetical protein